MGDREVEEHMIRYRLQHELLRFTVLSHADRFLDVIAEDRGPGIREYLAIGMREWETASCKPTDGIQGKIVDMPGAARAALITFPRPRNPLELYHAVAVIPKGNGTPRYFTLEAATSGNEAVVCEWTRTMHRNSGRRGTPDAAWFLEEVARQLAGPPGYRT